MNVDSDMTEDNNIRSDFIPSEEESTDSESDSEKTVEKVSVVLILTTYI